MRPLSRPAIFESFAVAFRASFAVQLRHAAVSGCAALAFCRRIPTQKPLLCSQDHHTPEPSMQVISVFSRKRSRIVLWLILWILAGRFSPPLEFVYRPATSQNTSKTHRTDMCSDYLVSIPRRGLWGARTAFSKKKKYNSIALSTKSLAASVLKVYSESTALALEKSCCISPMWRYREGGCLINILVSLS